MQSFVAPSAPSRALFVHSSPSRKAAAHGRSAATAPQTYWPCELLDAFILQMAARGLCVHAAMMLGHHPYALQQLALAREVGDASLYQLATQLQGYFEASVDDGPDGAALERAYAALP
jgi:hypothetical protein